MADTNVEDSQSVVINLSGLERTAILFLSLGEENAARLMKSLNPKEVRSIGLQMSRMSKVSRTEVEFVLSEFVNLLQNQTSLGIGSSEYIKDVLNKALGEDEASDIIDQVLLGGNSHGLESLKWMDPKEIAEIIRLEHPQIISIVLSYIEPKVAADVLKFLPENIRGDLMMRVATLDSIPPVAFRELDNILEKHFSSSLSGGGATQVGGVKKAAKIITFLEKKIEEGVMTNVTDNDKKLAEEI
jgi:flagellar motor switch protein FliG